MTLADAAPRGADVARPAGEDRDARDRGRLDVHPSVVKKVAARAVDRVPGTLPGASVKVRDRGDADVEVAVTVGLRYPAPIRAAAADVRRSVADEVERITGRRVLDVAVTVSALRSALRPRVE
ncbi:Asp23/Gls24 family envelope stress response protein [Saccharothrix australiensis]|uniref:Putative alkaline shock family protein YloU n=1 Tax=Saccharothrix australiensis TaxID=2072 RepID=A0A495VW01_9PSEU|nr:Asp23/Gls24 family envelope stress response protein [Saccharothrix australiensis]RKT53496.1 putative alkaline shock family protein YloU [Saccharothrix australiensis]